jgi:hypothetical protein
VGQVSQAVQAVQAPAVLTKPVLYSMIGVYFVVLVLEIVATALPGLSICAAYAPRVFPVSALASVHVHVTSKWYSVFVMCTCVFA